MRMLLTSLALVAMITTPALAQQTGSTTAANSGQAAQAGANANTQIQANVWTSNPDHTHATVWSTPSVQGSFFSGANPCLIGTGGGAAGGPVGFSINVGKNDEGCTRRSDAAAWHALGFDNVAVARLCQDLAGADAFYAATGEVCPGADRKRYKLADGSLPPVAIIGSRTIPVAAQ